MKKNSEIPMIGKKIWLSHGGKLELGTDGSETYWFPPGLSGNHKQEDMAEAEKYVKRLTFDVTNLGSTTYMVTTYDRLKAKRTSKELSLKNRKKGKTKYKPRIINRSKRIYRKHKRRGFRGWRDDAYEEAKSIYPQVTRATFLRLANKKNLP